jgi:hypothetical protein
MTTPSSLIPVAPGAIRPKLSMAGARSVRFGSESIPPAQPDAVQVSRDAGEAKPSILKDVTKELFGSPLPLWRRPLAFLSPSNWMAGFRAAKQAFQDSPSKGWEALGLAVDVAISLVTLKAMFVVDALFPNLMLSKTGSAFFMGIHQAAADKLKPPAETA